MLLVWLVYGRERKTGYDREYEQAPPTETEPALVPPLLRQETTIGSNEFTATLFDLIRRGRYKSTPVTTERKIWGGVRHEDVADLQLTAGDKSVALTAFEEPVAEVVDSVVGTDGARLTEFRDKIEHARATNSKRFTSFKEKVASAIDGRGWYRSDGVRVFGLAIVAFVVAAIVLLWVGIHGFRTAAPRWSDVVLVTLGVCAGLNAISLVVASTTNKALATPNRSRPDRSRALGCLPPLSHRLPAPAGGAARHARAVGALPRLRDRVRDRRARPPGRTPPHAGGAAQPECDLLDHPDRRPWLGADRARDRRPLLRLRLGACAAGLVRWGRRLLGRRRWRRRRRRRRRRW